MQFEQGNFEGTGGLNLYQATWQPDGEIKAVLGIVHGVGEHIQRYTSMAADLTAAGILVSGYDHRGHGRSEGQRGHINHWSEYRQDLSRFNHLLKQRYPRLPRFLFGHSMGSLILLDFLQEEGAAGLNGAIFSGTALEPLDAAPPLLVFIARALSRIVPRMALKVKLPGESLSRDPQVAEAYDKDPLVFWERSTRWGAETLRIIEKIKAAPEKINLPVLFIHGEEDPLLSAQGAAAFAQQVASTDKTVKIYPGSRHEPHNDLDRRQVMSDIIAFIQAHG
ncbi:MAG: alpha/beta hydrolase [Anaerolineae bacterium]|nr:MAG: alpha/beta hydrolase [Anaerolineae bacterium]